MRVPIQRRLELPRIPDHIFCDVILATTATDLRFVPVHADATVVRCGARRSRFSRES